MPKLEEEDIQQALIFAASYSDDVIVERRTIPRHFGIKNLGIIYGELDGRIIRTTVSVDCQGKVNKIF